jgi:hypothetical protein
METRTMRCEPTILTAARSAVWAATTAVLLTAAVPAAAASTIDLAEVDVPSVVCSKLDGQFGACLGVGDTDGDGGLELFVGAPGRAGADLRPHAGAVYMIDVADLAGVDGLTRIPELARAVFEGEHPRGRFGSSLVVADLDGDHYDDLVVGSPAADGGSIAAGVVSVWFGKSSNRHGDVEAPDVVVRGPRAGARLGASVLAADPNSDGATELVVSAPGRGNSSGEVYVIPGEALRSAGAVTGVGDVAAATVAGEAAGDEPVGLCVAGTGPQGTAELLVGACRADRGPDGPIDAGAVYSIPGGTHLSIPEGDSTTRLRESLPHPEGWKLTGPTGRSSFGRSISAGDVDGDGFDDLLISAHTSKAERKKLTAAGEVFLLFGDEDGWHGRSLDDEGVIRLRGRSNSDVLGSVVVLDDLGGDGLDDLFVTARYSDGPAKDRRDCGEVFVFRGSLRSVVAVKTSDIGEADVVVVGSDEHDSIGESLLVLDIDGDGKSELLIGAPDATRSNEEGESVTGCGAVLVVPGAMLGR